MSTNMLVSKYLEEWKTVDILLDVIVKSNAPRVVEIAMGILGNMACSPPIALNFSENKQLRDLVLATLGSSDARTLIETTRLITTCLSMQASQELWLSAISIGEKEVFDKLCFILQSSTNCDLLHATSNLVDTVLDVDEEILNDWATTTLIQAVTEAHKQVIKEKPEVVSMLLHILNILSTTDTGVETLVETTESILPLVIGYISSVCEQDDVMSVRGREHSISSAVSVLDVLANTSPPNLDAVLKHNPKTLPHLLCILAAAKDTSPGPSEPKKMMIEQPTLPKNGEESSSSPSDIASASQSDKKTEVSQHAPGGDEASQDSSVAEVSQNATVAEVSKDASVADVTQDASATKVTQNAPVEVDDSDDEEIECVAVVTKESNFLTDVLMEFFCNLLENHDAGTSDLISCINSCKKEHLDMLKQSLTETNPELLQVLDTKPSG
ncbi:protein saal1-like [Amphiura filiformis]|uniref:protein saal1-like n=1 Tax=Amphiura filiformis TaxID=82378 RepID=UPI003B20EECB